MWNNPLSPKGLSPLLFGIFSFEKNENVLDPFFLMFCKCQDVGVFAIRRPVNEFSLVNFLLTLTVMVNILGFSEKQPDPAVEFSFCFFPPQFPLPVKCSRNMSHILHIILKFILIYMRHLVVNSEMQKNIMHFLWVWLLSKCLRSVQLVRKQLLFLSAPGNNTDLTGKNQIPKSQIYLLKVIL